MAKTVPVRELRADLAELLDEVSDLREHIIVTRRGHRAVAIVPIDEYDALEETAEILADPRAVAAIEKGRAELKAGKTVTLNQLRKEHRARKRESLVARVVLAVSARRQFHGLGYATAEAVLDAIGLLEGDPELGYPLRGRFRGLRAVRIGSYRLIYEIRERGKLVRVCAILHRETAYRQDPR